MDIKESFYKQAGDEYKGYSGVGEEVSALQTYRRKVTPAEQGINFSGMQKICDAFNRRNLTEYRVEEFALDKLESVKCYIDGWEDALKHDDQGVARRNHQSAAPERSRVPRAIPARQ